MLLFNCFGVCATNRHSLISIHLMLLFNERQIRVMDIEHCYFNTSNVTIQRGVAQVYIIGGINFNTSNVTIQQTHNYSE